MSDEDISNYLAGKSKNELVAICAACIAEGVIYRDCGYCEIHIRTISFERCGRSTQNII